jgi:predicted transcriptional regulator
MQQNLTVRLDDATIRKAKVLAAKRSTSISRLVGEEIDRLVREDEAYEQARVEALDELESARDLGSGGRLPPRVDSYDR